MKQKFLLIAAIAATMSLTINAQEPATLSIGAYESADGDNAFDGFGQQNSPVLFNHVHSGVQVIYPAEELAEVANSKITSIAFKYYNEGAYSEYSSSMKIYLQESDLSAFEKDETTKKYKWFQFDAATPNTTNEFYQYFGDNMYDNGEVIFDLSDNPYAYSGKNLVVTVVNDGADDFFIEASEGTVRFYKTELSNKSLVFGSDKESYLDYLPKNPTATSNVEMHEAPAVKLTYQTVGAGVAEKEIGGVAVSGIDGAVSITTNDAARVEIYNIAGLQVIDETAAAGNHEFPLPAGLYIVKTGSTTAKVIVK